MSQSIWNVPLATFCDLVAARRPAPAGVASAVVGATCGLSLLVKALAITGRNDLLLEAAVRLSRRLQATADEDIAAVQRYSRTGDAADLERATEVPLRAARAAVEGLDLCVQATDGISGPVAADVVAGAFLLEGAVYAIWACIQANVRRLTADGAAPLAHLDDLEGRARQAREEVVSRLR